MANKIILLLILIFKRLGKVTENGLIAYSGLCNGIGDRINVESFGEFIVWALKEKDDECVRLACGLISDLAGALKEKMIRYIRDFVPPLLNILKD
jgi:hypothetical protein